MSDCKTGSDHIKSLKDGRTVYLDGKLVGDVTVHTAFRNSVQSAAALYDFQARPENLELMTFQPTADPRASIASGRCRATTTRWCSGAKRCRPGRRSPGGFLGRSPDHLASALVGQRMGIDVFASTAKSAPRR